MTNSRSVKEQVWSLIDRDPSLKLDLERGLINSRALARYCSGNGIEGSEDALISAIRRYPRDSRAKRQYDRAVDIVRRSAISSKSRVANIALRKGSDTQAILPKLFSVIDYERGETLRIIQGEESIKLLVDEKNLQRLLALIPQKLVLNVRKNLAELNLHLHEEAVKTPGIMLVITGELSRNNVNIYEIMSCVPEMLIFVDEADLMRAYGVLFDLCHGK